MIVSDLRHQDEDFKRDLAWHPSGGDGKKSNAIMVGLCLMIPGIVCAQSANPTSTTIGKSVGTATGKLEDLPAGQHGNYRLVGTVTSPTWVRVSVVVSNVTEHVRKEN